MVFFTCLNCGDSLQKPRVEKHYNTVCRGPVSVSCMDCFKDFHGDAYVQHTKCITEEERYAAKGFQAKPNANKGLQKQEKWIETIQTILKENPKLPSDQRQILNVIAKHDNVPRKKAKFQNFLKNVFPRANFQTVNAIFDLFENEHKKNNVSPQKLNGKSPIKSNKAEDDSQIINCTPKASNGSSKSSSNITNGKSKKDKCNSNDRFKWKPTILHFVSKKQSIKSKKLMKKVLQAYKLYHPELNDVSENVIKKYHIKLSKMKKVIVDEDLVKLK